VRHIIALSFLLVSLLANTSCGKTVSVKEEDYNATVQSLAKRTAECATYQLDNAALASQVKQLQLEDQLAAVNYQKLMTAKDLDLADKNGQILKLSDENATLKKSMDANSEAIKSKEVEISIKTEQLDIHKKAIDQSREDLSNTIKTSADAVAGQRQAVEEIKFRDDEIASLKKRVAEVEGGSIPIVIFGKQLPQVIANYSLMASVVFGLVTLLCVFLIYLLYKYSGTIAKRYIEQIHEGIDHKPAAAAAVGEFMEKVKLPMFVAGMTEAAIFVIIMLKQFAGSE
jgi:hypothetical protein